MWDVMEIVEYWLLCERMMYGGELPSDPIRPVGGAEWNVVCPDKKCYHLGPPGSRHLHLQPLRGGQSAVSVRVSVCVSTTFITWLYEYYEAYWHTRNIKILISNLFLKRKIYRRSIFVAFCDAKLVIVFWKKRPKMPKVAKEKVFLFYFNYKWVRLNAILFLSVHFGVPLAKTFNVLHLRWSTPGPWHPITVMRAAVLIWWGVMSALNRKRKENLCQ